MPLNALLQIVVGSIVIFGIVTYLADSYGARLVLTCLLSFPFGYIVGRINRGKRRH